MQPVEFEIPCAYSPTGIHKAGINNRGRLWFECSTASDEVFLMRASNMHVFKIHEGCAAFLDAWRSVISSGVAGSIVSPGWAQLSNIRGAIETIRRVTIEAAGSRLSSPIGEKDPLLSTLRVRMFRHVACEVIDSFGSCTYRYLKGRASGTPSIRVATSGNIFCTRGQYAYPEIQVNKKWLTLKKEGLDIVKYKNHRLLVVDKIDDGSFIVGKQSVGFSITAKAATVDIETKSVVICL